MTSANTAIKPLHDIWVVREATANFLDVIHMVGRRLTHVLNLRERIPAPISICHSALNDNNGDVELATKQVIQWLAERFAERTNSTSAQSAKYLSEAGYDLERAVVLWNRENPPPSKPPIERLIAGEKLAASSRAAEESFRVTVHIIPHSGGNYEIRRFKHHERFTEANYGWDYDYALYEPTTRAQRVVVRQIEDVARQLAEWGFSIDSLVSCSEVDCCLVHSSIDTYLKPGQIAHLWLNDS